MALTPHSVIMTRLYGDIVKSIEWSQRFLWWTSFVSEHQYHFHFEASLILSKGLWILGGGKHPFSMNGVDASDQIS